MAQGLYIATILIVSFMLLAATGLYFLATGNIDIDTLEKYFTGLGVLAGIFGIGPIITAYVITRGQTSGEAA